MKKNLISLVIAVAITGITFAQESSRNINTETKKGTNILPAAGDFAIGVETNPFLNYIGNLMSENRNEAPLFNAQQGSLTAKYFLTDKSAIRTRLGFDFRNNKEYKEVDKANNQTDEKVENIIAHNNNYFQIAVGYELRRGYGRLQGFYGGEIIAATGGMKKTYTYGNPLTITNQEPPRPLEENNGKGFMFGIGGFAGVEYFVAPKLSIGGEFGLQFSTMNIKNGETITEFWNTTNGQPDTETVNYEKYKNVNLRTNTTGNINLTFHF